MEDAATQDQTVVAIEQARFAMPEKDIKRLQAFFGSGPGSLWLYNYPEIIITEDETAAKVLATINLPAVTWGDFRNSWESFSLQHSTVKTFYFLVANETVIPPEIMKSGCALVQSGKRVYVFSLPADMPSIGHFLNLNAEAELKKLMADARSIVDFLIEGSPAEATKAMEYINNKIAPLIAAHVEHVGLYTNKIAKNTGVPKGDVLRILQQAIIERRGITGFSIDKKGHLVAKEFNLQYSEQERRDALIVLDELSRMFSSSLATFATVIYWILLSPYSYAIKQLQKTPYQWLLLLGPPATGKTTLAKTCAYIWRLPIAQFETSAATIGTVPGLAHVLSRWSFPVLINESAELFDDKGLTEVIKNACEAQTVRSVVRGHLFLECPSIAALIMTANKEMPLTAAVRRRVKVIHLSLSDKPSPAQRDKFKQWQPNLQKLPPLGAMVYEYVRNDLSIFDTDDFAAAGTAILRQLYANVGLAVPSWVGLRLPDEEGDDAIQNSSTRSELVNLMHQYVIDRLRSVGVYKEKNLRGRLRCLMEYNIPSDILFYKKCDVIIKKGFLKYLASKGHEISSLSHLAQVLEGEYRERATIRSLGFIGVSLTRVALSKLELYTAATEIEEL